LAFTATQLHRDGWETVEYEAGQAVLTAYKGQFQVAVVDQKMPGLTGLETAARLRGLGFAGPIVLMSAWLEADTLAQAARLGVMAASKVDQVSFFRVMDILLNQVRRAHPVAAGEPS